MADCSLILYGKALLCSEGTSGEEEKCWEVSDSLKMSGKVYSDFLPLLSRAKNHFNYEWIFLSVEMQKKKL